MFRTLWKGFFDVRAGEYLRTIFMALYLMFVLFAYYILKPVSRALFLNQFDIDKLPYLYILIAVGGGILAYLYTKLAVKSSLKVAVGWSTALLRAPSGVFSSWVRAAASLPTEMAFSESKARSGAVDKSCASRRLS